MIKKKITLILLMGLSISSAYSQEKYNLSDFSKKEIKLLKKLSGEYVNSRNDKLALNFNILKENGQLDLFGSKTFEYYGQFESNSKDNESYDFELNSLDIVDNEYIFSDIENECDDPGCITYETYFTFKENKKGDFYVKVDLSVEVDVEELAETHEENQYEDADKLEEILDDGCREMLGEDSFLVTYVDDYKYSVYCGYEKTYYLKRK